jgi:hypothetical protein
MADIDAQVAAFKIICAKHCLKGEECQARLRMFAKRPLDDGRVVTWYLLYFNCGEKKGVGNDYPKTAYRKSASLRN